MSATVVLKEQAKEAAMDVLLHPLVIVNISDHFTREKVRTGKARRVFGILLGTQSGRRVEVSNSFEILLVGDTHTIDKEFLQARVSQLTRVFEKSEILGWYSTGKNAEGYDMQIHQQVEQHNESPLYLLLNPEPAPGSRELPLSLTETTVRVVDDKPTVVFTKVPYRVETTEAERIAVDHLQNVSAGGRSLLTSHLSTLHSAIKMLNLRIKAILQFAKAAQNNGPRDEGILRQINALVQELPAIDTDKFKEDFLTEYNDALLVTYLASITKTSHAVNEMIEKFNITYDRHSRRRGFM